MALLNKLLKFHILQRYLSNIMFVTMLKKYFIVDLISFVQNLVNLLYLASNLAVSLLSFAVKIFLLGGFIFLSLCERCFRVNY